MNHRVRERLIILGGPSAVGKSLLEKAFRKLYPEISKTIQRLVVYNSRNPRPGEVEGIDYFFRNEDELHSLRKNAEYLVSRVRGDLQAINIKNLLRDLTRGEVLFEGNTYLGRALQLHERLEQVQKLSVFISPLCKEEIQYFNDPDRSLKLQQICSELIRRKLLLRTRKQKEILSLADLQNTELRVAEAWDELQLAHHFDWIIPNHDGEDSDHWDILSYPIGEARKALQEFVNLIQGKKPILAERWPELKL